MMLGAMEGASPDPNDAATSVCTPPPNRDYTVHLKRDGLKGARIGIPRAFYFDKVTVPGEKEPRGGLSETQAQAMAEAIAILKAEGAEIVDPADIPSIVDSDPQNNFLAWGTCSGADSAAGKDANCSVVLKYGMKRDFNAWLATLNGTGPVKTLTELRQWNTAHQNRGAIKYGQANLDVSDAMDLVKDRPRWEADRKKDIRLGATHGMDEVMKAQNLDAILFPGASGAAIAAKPGYPTVIVPFALVANAPTPAFPAGFKSQAHPLRRQLLGTGLQRTAPHRTGLRLRAGFEEARAAAVGAVGAVQSLV